MILVVSQIRIGDTYRNSRGEHHLKCKLEDLTGQPVLVQHYSQVNPGLLAQLPISAIFITGSSVLWSEYKVADLYGLSDVITTTDIPVLGVCAGHQTIGHFFNNNIRELEQLEDSLMRKLRPGEADLMPTYRPGYFTEYGMWPVSLLAADPIFEGFDDSIMISQAHGAEVKKLPPDFVHLARNDNCEIQAMRHKDRAIYGTQFHPEMWTEEYPDGKQVVENFFGIAGLVK